MIAPHVKGVVCLFARTSCCVRFKGEARYDKDHTSQLAHAQNELNRELIELLILEAPPG